MRVEILFRRREADAVFAEVVDGVVLAEEGVTDDPDRAWTVSLLPKKGRGCGGGVLGTKRRGNVEALEGGDAGSLGLHDVVRGGEGKIVSGKGEGDIG